jgi:hypothetical protein
MRGKQIELRQLIDESTSDPITGQYSMQDLQGLLARHGQQSFGVHFATIQYLKPLLPCIIHYRGSETTDGGHFVLLCNVTEPFVTILDGAKGMRQIRCDDPAVPITDVAITIRDDQPALQAAKSCSVLDRSLITLAIFQAAITIAICYDCKMFKCSAVFTKLD